MKVVAEVRSDGLQQDRARRPGSMESWRHPLDEVVREAAWKTFKMFAQQNVPHELPVHLRSMGVSDAIIDWCIARHNEEATKFFELKEPVGIGREDQPPWYVGPQAGDRNWPAMEARLHKSLDDESVARIDEASSKVVAMLDHPATRLFDSRGLVVGHVQSGKTSNFTSVIAKAADRGYKLVIVLSGVHNALRRQTQIRLIKDLIEPNPALWHQLTTPDRDFQPSANPASMLAVKDQHILLVVKKNTAVLKKLKKWLGSAHEQLKNFPALVIDDEADQATVATKKINPLIRDVLDQLPRVCFVGYTATPFGNLLIDPADDRDFYPRDFILSLPRSGNYQGPETLFGRDPLDGEDPDDVPGGQDMIREIDDDELGLLRPAKQADAADFEPTVTGSLRSAVLWFWLATAARRVRDGEPRHSSMLLHAHSDTRVHDAYAEPLQEFKEEVFALLQAKDLAILTELQEHWEIETLRVTAEEQGCTPVSWDQIETLLADVVSDTKVIRDHYRSKDRLDYDSGPTTVIAVGGNTLSRGLTLEGLVVSFFVRSSSTYDTLLQMGRWFGYRPGYEDLPRIWMPTMTRQWFAHLATVEAEMRREIDRYLVEHKSPRDLAVRIRCHPAMRVTAPAKMTHAIKAAASYGGQLIETRYFRCSPTDDARLFHEQNASAAEQLLRDAYEEGRRDSDVSEARLLYRGVPARSILNFIDAYAFDPQAVEYSSALVRDYIGKRMNQGGLATWNVGVIGNEKVGAKRVTGPAGLDVGTVSRTRIANSQNEDPVADIKTLTGSRDPGLDLKFPSGGLVNRENLKRWRTEQQPETGLLLLYPIDGQSSAEGKVHRADLNAPVDVVWGAAFTFPNPISGSDVLVEYDYVQADLSKVFAAAAEDDEAIDLSVLDEDQDSDTGTAV